MKKNREKILLQNQSMISVRFRDLVISYDELENNVKPLGEKFKINDSENN